MSDQNFDAEPIIELLGEAYREFFEENGIELTQHNLGWSESQQKWYGFSHRAIYGFGIGSEVKKGDCAYTGSAPEDLIKSHVEFFGDIAGDGVIDQERAQQARDECQILPDRSGIRILHRPLMIPMADSLEQVAEAIEGDQVADLPETDINPSFSIVKCGRGEWAAETLEDARLMALDFAAGVS